MGEILIPRIFLYVRVPDSLETFWGDAERSWGDGLYNSDETMPGDGSSTEYDATGDGVCDWRWNPGLKPWIL